MGTKMELPETDAAFLSDLEELDEELDDAEDELRRAARAGILLLEKNQELSLENAALRAQVAALESEKPGFERALQRHESELAALREERRTSLLEITRLQAELRSTSQLVTSSLDREQRLKREKEGTEKALAAAEERVGRLQEELELARACLASHEQAAGGFGSRRSSLSDDDIATPVAPYSARKSSFSLADYEELLAKWQRSIVENDMLRLEMKSLRKDVDALRRKAARTTELGALAELLEKKAMQLQYANDALIEELNEERALCESQRAMIAVYKKIADARLFSTECTCVLHSDDDDGGLGISLQEQLLETNTRLERELRELRRGVSSSEEEDEGSCTADDSTDNNSIYHLDNNDEDHDHEHLHADEPVPTLVGLETVASNAEIDLLISKIHRLEEKIQRLEENQSALQDGLRHAQEQLQASMASQKAMEESTRAEELSRLTEPSPSPSCASLFPTLPDDLDSPFIKSLLARWMSRTSPPQLPEWLRPAHHAAGPLRPLRIDPPTRRELFTGHLQAAAKRPAAHHRRSRRRDDGLSLARTPSMPMRVPSSRVPPPLVHGGLRHGVLGELSMPLDHRGKRKLNTGMKPVFIPVRLPFLLFGSGSAPSAK